MKRCGERWTSRFLWRLHSLPPYLAVMRPWHGVFIKSRIETVSQDTSHVFARHGGACEMVLLVCGGPRAAWLGTDL